jgi:RNA polymerase sigma factor (TIGR02999 family)
VVWSRSQGPWQNERAGGADVADDMSTTDDFADAGASPGRRTGDGPGSSAELLPEVYDELRRLARSRLAREPGGLTLQPTALVHEAYLRLVGDDASRLWDRRGHFFAAAAIAMRRILVERARHYRRVKHGGEQRRVELDVGTPAARVDPAEVLAVDSALTQLERMDPRKAQVVMLRYFAGLTVEETATALQLSPATVKNDWAFARAWLHHALRGTQPPAGENSG